MRARDAPPLAHVISQHTSRSALEEKDRELEKCMHSLRDSEKDLIATKKELQELEESLAYGRSHQSRLHTETSIQKGLNKAHEETGMLNSTSGNNHLKGGSGGAPRQDVAADADQQQSASRKGDDSADSWGEGSSGDESNSKAARERAGRNAATTPGSQEQEHTDASMQVVANRDLNFVASDQLSNKAGDKYHTRSSEQELHGTKSRRGANHYVDVDGVDVHQLQEALNDLQRQLEIERTKSDALERKVQELQEELHILGKELAAAEEENEKDLRKAMAAIKAAEMAAESSLRIDKGSLLQVFSSVSYTFGSMDLSSKCLLISSARPVQREPAL
jgi:DNA repair exonuclease SbcCD ATPase subunit